MRLLVSTLAGFVGGGLGALWFHLRGIPGLRKKVKQ